ncbi:MAG TPA: response regulator [Bryobacteraceae bacterium]|nr:response regulator [Bryobacteraceae bacterium]
MTRILLADDSPHAQRMGERILREEGFEVVTVTDGQTAMLRLADVDPDVVFADVSLPRKSGYDICREIKNRSRHKHVRVILTAGLLETFDEKEATVVQCDGILKKPFEASVVIEMLKPLVESAQKDKAEYGPDLAANGSGIVGEKVVTDPNELAPPDLPPGIDVERVRAAVTLALDAAMPSMIDKITEQVLVALRH